MRTTAPGPEDDAPFGGGTLAQGKTFISSQVFNQAAAVIRGLVLPNLLGPAAYGALQVILLVEKYSNYVTLGVHTVNLYLIPRYRAEGKSEQVERLQGAIHGVSLWLGLTASLAVLGLVLHQRAALEPAVFWGLLAMSAMPITIALRGAYMTALRGDRDFRGVGIVTNITSLTTVLILLPLAYGFRLVGAAVGQVISTAIAVAYARRRAALPFSRKLDGKLVLSLLRFGVPVHLILGSVGVTMANLHVPVVLAHWGTSQLGQYALGLSISSWVLVVPNSLVTLLSTSVIEGTATRTEGQQPRWIQGTYLICFATLVLGSLMAVTMDIVVPFVFPGFVGAAGLAGVLPAYYFFQAMGGLSHYVVTGDRKLLNIYILSLAAILGAGYLLSGVLIAGDSLYEVAALMTGLAALTALTRLVLAAAAEGLPWRKLVVFLADLLVLLALFGGAVATAQVLWPQAPNTLLGVVKVLGLRLLLVAGAIAAGTVYVSRRSRATRLALAMGVDKMRTAWKRVTPRR